MRRVVFPLFLILAGINVFFASWSVLHGDINFISDVARDMFLLKEIEQKTIVLIGPRASGNMFHGPLWSYLNYPGYVIGSGNPVVAGWYWIFLIILFLVASFVIAKRLFNRNTAMLFVLMTSLYLAFHANEMFHPYGAMFLLPIFFYFFVRYAETDNIRFLVYHLLTGGAIVQFEIAIGVPFLILSIVFSLVVALKKNNPKHLLVFFIIPAVLANFILFDVRHEFILTKNALRHLGTSASNTYLLDLVRDRVMAILTKIEFLRFGPPNGQFYSMVVFIAFTCFQIVNKIHRKTYIIFLCFFLGYFSLTLFNRYHLLTFYIFPLIPFVFLIFSSFITSVFKRAFLFIFLIMYGLNLVGLYTYIRSLDVFIGKDQYSWKAVFAAAQTAFEGEEKEFGYFIYSPDILGYGPRYAMEYARKVNNKNGFAFEKKPVTYLLIEPPARDNPFTSEEKWKLYQIHIYSEPVMVKTFENGYKLEKHLLTDDQLTVPFDPGINPGLHYR